MKSWPWWTSRDGSSVKAWYRQALEDAAPMVLDREAALVDRDGTPGLSVEVSASPIREDDAVAGLVVVMHDVTALRGTARAMSYKASHDPLTGICQSPGIHPPATADPGGRHP